MENNLHIQYIDEKYIKLDLLSNNQGLETWLVKDNCTGKLFLLKETMPELAEIYRTLQLFPNKNLAAIYETFKPDNKFIVIEEFISGDTLEEIINKGNANVHTSFYIIKQILEVLIFLHGINIIHRDINPRNILVSTDGVVKLIDFGIARKYKEGSSNDTAILGTAGFAAPEQFGFCISLDPSMRYQSALEAYTALISTTTASKVNTVPSKQDNSPYCLPGFRSNTPWKKTLSISFYIIMAIYIFASLKECSKTPASFFLELTALFLYIIFAFIIVTDYGKWTGRLWPVSRLNKSLKIFIRIIFFIFIFYYGVTIEEYVRYTMLGIPRPK